jgi:fumarate hydratase class I
VKAKKRLVELIRRTATDLPSDVERSLLLAHKRESSSARNTLGSMLENVRLARSLSIPLCQDTGVLVFHVTAPPSANREKISSEIVSAVRMATKSVPLRPNSVDPITGKNTKDNTGVGLPSIMFREWDRRKIRYELMLKGGGSENITRLYSLPDSAIQAGRDLAGVGRCVLDALVKAQGKGCPPYVIGVGIGGMADAAITLGKRQLMRGIGDKNRDTSLAKLESRLLRSVNGLGIGPMGLGGSTTALAVKVAKQHRHPASYFVAVTFMCWSCRRRSIEVPL